MPTREFGDRCFDARPDRIDYRDRPYSPRLISLPDRFPSVEFVQQFFPDYAENKLVLDQKSEGACTGFGLAAVVNYLLWKDQLESKTFVPLPDEKGFLLRPEALWDTDRAIHESVEPVSAHMLYHLARLYDEWPGEDYEGSSCRGAMKGWYRHGVCLLKNWPKSLKAGGKRLKSDWNPDAAQRPLGAYYRINKDTLNDLQAAIHEVGAIYVSASVHAGWMLDPKHTKSIEHDDEVPELPIVPMDSLAITGGHAFALVGYTKDGFIVQNSWGTDWGFQGFAVLRYPDWMLHGADAWVAVMGAAVRVPKGLKVSGTRSGFSLGDVVSGKSNWAWGSATSGPAENRGAAAPWDDQDAYEHSVVLGNDGRPLNRFVAIADAESAVKEAAFNQPNIHLPRVAAKLPGAAKPKLVVYAHGGLNNEDASIKRIRVLAPYFEANGIYPLFITWRTGFWESISGILDDAVQQFVFGGTVPAGAGLFDDIKQRLQDAKDRTLEAACEHILVKPVWSQMKQNAAVAGDAGGGLALVVQALAKLKTAHPGLEIHLVGHSAGSILLGHLLTAIKKQFTVESVELYAAACTVEFANRHYVAAINRGIFGKKSLLCQVLSDHREQDDSIGPYGKSLLYLVSRALEQVHKMPLLGMEGSWHDVPDAPDLWNSDKPITKQVMDWRGFVGKDEAKLLRIHDESPVSDGVESLAIAHGSFDNDIAVIYETIKRIRGAKPVVNVTNLHGF